MIRKYKNHFFFSASLILKIPVMITPNNSEATQIPKELCVPWGINNRKTIIDRMPTMA